MAAFARSWRGTFRANRTSSRHRRMPDFDPKRTDLGLLQLWPNPRHLVVACLVLAVRWEMLKCAPPVGRALMAQASLR